MRSLACAAMLLCAGCGAVLGPDASPDNAAVFDGLWRSVDRHYSYFEYKHIAWDSLGTHYRPLALAAATDDELAGALGDLLAELHDVHVALLPTDRGPRRFISPFDTLPTFYDPAATLGRHVGEPRQTSGRHLTYGMAASDVAYVRVPGLAGSGWAAELDDALAALAGARALILDLRNNAGGRTSLALELAGRFVEREAVFGRLRFRNGAGHGDFTDYVAERVRPAGARRFAGPLAVLTNRRVYSSAEQLVMALRTRPRVTVIGDTTGGASGGPVVRELPNGWTYQVSEWIEYTLDGSVVEGVGLDPDIVVRPGPDDLRFGRDSVMRRAVAVLRAAP